MYMMAPNIENPFSSQKTKNSTILKPPRLSMEGLQRTISDISFELTKETTNSLINSSSNQLPPISEVEDTKCECCGMSEECTPGYISNVRSKFLGKLICGLCAEAVEEEMVKNGGKRDEALSEHMNGCMKFNRIGRTCPVLLQADAMREILKKSSRAKSLSPREVTKGLKKGASISRSLSCMPVIVKEIGYQNNKETY